jgi:hypothetical protein
MFIKSRKPLVKFLQNSSKYVLVFSFWRPLWFNNVNFV